METYYFDHNATTPMAPEVLKAMEPYWTEHFANPSSTHQLGRIPARALRDARRSVARLLLVSEDSEIVFTSGGTESNNAAIRAALFLAKGKNHIVTSAVEHSSVLKLCRELRREGYDLTEIPVNSQGQMDGKAVIKAIQPETALVSLMLANNETGVIFPIAEIGKRLRERKILFHVDAVQAIGKIPVNVPQLSVDFLSLSAHKFYGPKGVGAHYVRKGINCRPLIFGGSQERGRRAGTENVPAIVGLGAASRMAMEDLKGKNDEVRKMRDDFEAMILREIPDSVISGAQSERIPNTSNIRFEGVLAESLLATLDEKGIFVSSGSACMSGSAAPSHVLLAMGLSDREARTAIRFSFGKYNSKESVLMLVNEVKQAVQHIRSLSGVGI